MLGLSFKHAAIAFVIALFAIYVSNHVQAVKNITG
jgi:hypothetical protein